MAIRDQWKRGPSVEFIDDDLEREALRLNVKDSFENPIDDYLPQGTRVQPSRCCSTCGKPLPYYDYFADGGEPYCGRCFQARIDACDAQIARGGRYLPIGLVLAIAALIAVLAWSVS